MKQLTLRQIRKSAINKFIKFLVKKGVYNEFLRNATIALGIDNDSFLNKLRKRDIENVIDYSFCWHETPEGSQFWRELHYEWENYFRYYCEEVMRKLTV